VGMMDEGRMRTHQATCFRKVNITQPRVPCQSNCAAARAHEYNVRWSLTRQSIPGIFTNIWGQLGPVFDRAHRGSVRRSATASGALDS
jgi:hypothetical protein